MEVTVRNGRVDKALSIFRKKSAEILLEVREREFYEKPTSARRSAYKQAVAREKRRQKEVDRNQYT